MSNYGIDLEGPVPPHESESEVPETVCPLDLQGVEGMAQFVAPEGMLIHDVVELFINAVEFVTHLLQMNAHAEMA